MNSRTAVPPLTRGQSLGACPVKTEVVDTDALPEGGLRVTVAAPRPRWHRWFGGDGDLQRSFELDALGAAVYDACDGTRDVRALIADFAAAHQVSTVEAEIAVTTYLRTLVSRGLVAMVVDRQEASDD